MLFIMIKQGLYRRSLSLCFRQKKIAHSRQIQTNTPSPVQHSLICFCINFKAHIEIIYIILFVSTTIKLLLKLHCDYRVFRLSFFSIFFLFQLKTCSVKFQMTRKILLLIQDFKITGNILMEDLIFDSTEKEFLPMDFFY